LSIFNVACDAAEARKQLSNRSAVAESLFPTVQPLFEKCNDGDLTPIPKLARKGFSLVVCSDAAENLA
jgi:hypothetical protein